LSFSGSKSVNTITQLKNPISDSFQFHLNPSVAMSCSHAVSDFGKKPHLVVFDTLGSVLWSTSKTWFDVAQHFWGHNTVSKQLSHLHPMTSQHKVLQGVPKPHASAFGVAQTCVNLTMHTPIQFRKNITSAIGLTGSNAPMSCLKMTDDPAHSSCMKFLLVQIWKRRATFFWLPRPLIPRAGRPSRHEHAQVGTLIILIVLTSTVAVPKLMLLSDS